MRFPVLFSASVAIGLLASGCGPQSRQARHVKQADAYYVAGNLDAAEIEYRNALKAVPMEPYTIGQLGLIYYAQGRQIRAFSFLTKGVELQPNNLDLKVKLAALQLAGRKLPEARATALAVLARRPQDPEAPVLLAEAALQTKDIAEAREHLQALPAPAPEGAPVLVALGILELRQRRVAEAEALFKKALTRDPKSAEANGALGLIHLSRKETAEAEAAFKAAADAAPLRSPRRLQYAQFKLQQGDAATGRQLLEAVAKQTPDYLPVWLALAQLALGERKIDEALGHLGKVMARESVHPEAMLLSGKLRVAKGEVDKGIAELERAASMFSTLPQAHYELGQAYLAKGDTAKATTSLNTAVNLAPTFADAVVAQAGLNLRMGETTRAVASLQKVVQQRPDLLQAHSLLADGLRQLGKLDEAVAAYATVEKLFPRLPTGPFYRGLVLAQQRKYPEARKAFLRAVELSPTFVAAVEQLVALDLRDKKPDDARTRTEALITRTPKSASGYLLLARVMLSQKDQKLAELALRKAIAVEPQAPAAYLLLARLQLSGSETDKALASLRDAVAKNPVNVEALMLLSAVYQQQKNHTAARETYEKLVTLAPRSGAVHNNLAYLYAEQFGELDKALESAQRARELLPVDPNVADTLGWVLFRKRQFAQAVVLLQESAAKLPNSAEVHYHLGMTHYMLGETAAAKAALEKALELAADFPGSADAKARLVVLGGDAAALGVAPKIALEKVVAERKDDPVALTRLAQIYEQERAFDKALATYQAALAASPNNATVMLGLSRTLAARKEDAKALDMARAARKAAPDDPDVAHLLGRLAVQSGQHSWGLSLLQEAARRKPDSPEILFDTAEASFVAGRATDAVAHMRKALALNAAFPQADRARRFLELIDAAAKPGDTALAARVDAALKANPNDAPALMASGAIQEAKRDAAGARKTYEKVLGLYPDLVLAKRQLAILAAHGSEAVDRKAFEYATKARETYPDDAEVAKALGILTYRQGGNARAITLLQEATAKRPGDADALFYLGLARHKQKDRNGAKQALQAALDAKLAANHASEARKVLAELK